MHLIYSPRTSLALMTQISSIFRFVKMEETPCRGARTEKNRSPIADCLRWYLSVVGYHNAQSHTSGHLVSCPHCYHRWQRPRYPCARGVNLSTTRCRVHGQCDDDDSLLMRHWLQFAIVLQETHEQKTNHCKALGFLYTTMPIWPRRLNDDECKRSFLNISRICALIMSIIH